MTRSCKIKAYHVPAHDIHSSSLASIYDMGLWYALAAFAPWCEDAIMYLEVTDYNPLAMPWMTLKSLTYSLDEPCHLHCTPQRKFFLPTLCHLIFQYSVIWPILRNGWTRFSELSPRVFGIPFSCQVTLWLGYSTDFSNIIYKSPILLGSS